jgi:hypothetical protein
MMRPLQSRAAGLFHQINPAQNATDGWERVNQPDGRGLSAKSSFTSRVPCTYERLCSWGDAIMTCNWKGRLLFATMLTAVWATSAEACGWRRGCASSSCRYGYSSCGYASPTGYYATQQGYRTGGGGYYYGGGYAGGYSGGYTGGMAGYPGTYGGYGGYGYGYGRGYNPGGLGGPYSGLGVRPGPGFGGLGRGR